MNVRILIFLCMPFFTVSVLATDYLYTPTVPTIQDHKWNNSLNWTPPGVPGAGDNVTISDSVYVNSNISVNNVTFSGIGVIETDATLTILGTFSWSSGILRGIGTIVANGAVEVSGNSHKNLYQLTFENYDTLTWSGDGEIKLNNDAHFINKPSGVINAQNNSRMDYVQKNHGGYLTNYGIIKKNGSSGGSWSQTQIDPILINYGTISVENGIMQIERGDSTTASNGTFNVASSCTLNFVDRPFRCDGATFTGNGVVQLVKDDFRPTFIVLGSGATFSANTTLRLDIDATTVDYGYIGGAGTLTVNGTFEWIQGGLFDAGSMVVNGSTLFTQSTGRKYLKERTLILKGTTDYSSTKGIVFQNGGSLINEAGATFTKTTNAPFDSTSGIPSGTFENRGTFVYTFDNSLNMEVRCAVTNLGTLQLQANGKIIFRKNFNNEVTGLLSGIGTLDFRKTFTNNGSISPGNSAGKLTIVSKPLTMSAGSALTVEIGGTVQGTDYDWLSGISNSPAIIDGTLNVSLINSFEPSAGQSFRIISVNGSLSGTFATVNQPQFQGSDMFTVSYGSNYVDLISNFDSSLPVELISFKAVGSYRRVSLSWTTASEINNLGFEIYRSEAENGAYQLIASYQTDLALRGNGSSNSRRDYVYEDTNVAEGHTYLYQLADVSFDGKRTFHPKISVETANQPNLTNNFTLSQNYPNPFNPETIFRFTQTRESITRITVYDLLGRRVRFIHNGILEAGEYVFRWQGDDENGTKVSAGVYLLLVEAIAPENGSVRFVGVRKMVLNR